MDSVQCYFHQVIRLLVWQGYISRNTQDNNISKTLSMQRPYACWLTVLTSTHMIASYNILLWIPTW
jgi:hypothetical protein